MAYLDHEDEELGVMHHVDDAPVPDPDAELALAALERLGSGRPRRRTERLDSVGDAAWRRGSRDAGCRGAAGVEAIW
jgi:hypothetical protein